MIGEPARRLPWLIVMACGATPTTAALSSPYGAARGMGATNDTTAVEFSDAFTGTDMSRFEREATVVPGHYNLDIYVNEGRVARQDVEFRAAQDMRSAQPCFSFADLSQFGVNVSGLDATMVHPRNPCIAIGDIGPEATVAVDLGELRMDVSIPQASLLRQARGYVSPELWDQGASAFLLGYDFNAYSIEQGWEHASAPGSRTAVGTYAYLGLNLGLNVAGWRIRNQETAQWDQRAGKTRWTNVNTTLTHDITAWQAQVTLGDSYTQGIVFDTTAFRGITLYSDDRMRPDSQQGYAPVVRGSANTQARVEVHQNGHLVHQTTVAPGPFVVDDLYATGYGGDLTVSVFEADGSVQAFVVPYSAVPMLLRPGIGRWTVTEGQVRHSSLRNDTPRFVEGTYQRGMGNWLTLYGGAQLTHRERYRAYLVGAAVSTPIGAFALDVSRSRTTGRGTRKALSGFSYRASYSKAVPSTGTTLALASYRYSNGRFVSLSDAMSPQETDGPVYRSTPDFAFPARQKQRLNLAISQAFSGHGGQMFVNASRHTYWDGVPDATTFQLGYSNTWHRLNVGFTASRTYAAGPMYKGARYHSQFGVTVSLPLGGPSSRHAPRIQFNGTRDDLMGDNSGIGVSGTFGRDSRFSYASLVSRSDHGNATAQTSASANAGWQAPYANLNGSYSQADRYRQASVSASGGVVVHGGGVTLSPALDLTSPVAIVEAPAARGAWVSGGSQTRVDRRGYAVATGLVPYRMNDVTIDPRGMSIDVELQTTRLQSAPRAGAVVPLTFATIEGRAVLIRAIGADGHTIPFGAEVLDDTGHSIGSMGQAGQIFIRGAENGGTLLVRWGEQPNEACRIRYELPVRARGAASAFDAVDGICR